MAEAAGDHKDEPSLVNPEEFKRARIWQHDFLQPVRTTGFSSRCLLLKAGWDVPVVHRPAPNHCTSPYLAPALQRLWVPTGAGRVTATRQQHDQKKTTC